MARKKKEIKQDNFYTIRYWMPEKLHLGGTKLLVYGFLCANLLLISFFNIEAVANENWCSYILL